LASVGAALVSGRPAPGASIGCPAPAIGWPKAGASAGGGGGTAGCATGAVTDGGGDVPKMAGCDGEDSGRLGNTSCTASTTKGAAITVQMAKLRYIIAWTSC